MEIFLNHRNQQDFDLKFSPYFGIASVIHLLLFLSLYFYSFFNGKSFHKQKELIVRSSIKVDVVDLPKYTLRELRKVGPPINTQVDAIKNQPVDTTTQFLEKGKIPSFRDVLKNLKKKKVAKKKRKRNLKKEKSLWSKISVNELSDVILAGNKITEGNSGSGSEGQFNEKVNEEFTRYLGRIPDDIRPFWKIPTYLAEQELQCRIRVFISGTGEVLKTIVYESSGNEEYDQRAVDAIKKASPFSRPTEFLRNKLANGDIILGFPL